MLIFQPAMFVYQRLLRRIKRNMFFVQGCCSKPKEVVFFGTPNIASSFKS